MTVTMAGLALGVMSVSATLIVDVDGAAGKSISGTTHTFEANQGGGGIPNNASPRYTSVTLSGTDRVAVIDGTGGTDYYAQWNNIASTGLDASTYRYAEIHYSLDSTFTASAASAVKIRLGDTVTVTGGSGANNHPSNPELINSGAALAAGSHSFIIDLTEGSTTAYAGDWKYFRWNFFNTAANAGKTFTIDKITYATDVIPEPATLGLLGAFGGGILFIRRRFMI